MIKSRGIAPAVAWAAGRIEQSSGAVSIAELRRQTGLSKTRLAEAFRDQIGLAQNFMPASFDFAAPRDCCRKAPRRSSRSRSPRVITISHI